jgi:hypothetical protein
LHTPFVVLHPPEGAGQSEATVHFLVQSCPLLVNEKHTAPTSLHEPFGPQGERNPPPPSPLGALASTTLPESRPPSTPGVVPSQTHAWKPSSVTLHAWYPRAPFGQLQPWYSPR